MPPGPQHRYSRLPRHQRHRERRRRVPDHQHRNHVLVLELVAQRPQQRRTETAVLGYLDGERLHGHVPRYLRGPQVRLGDVLQGLVEGARVALRAGRRGDAEEQAAGVLRAGREQNDREGQDTDSDAQVHLRMG